MKQVQLPGVQLGDVGARAGGMHALMRQGRRRADHHGLKLLGPNQDKGTWAAARGTLGAVRDRTLGTGDETLACRIMSDLSIRVLERHRAVTEQIAARESAPKLGDGMAVCARSTSSGKEGSKLQPSAVRRLWLK